MDPIFLPFCVTVLAFVIWSLRLKIDKYYKSQKGGSGAASHKAFLFDLKEL